VRGGGEGGRGEGGVWVGLATLGKMQLTWSF